MTSNTPQHSRRATALGALLCIVLAVACGCTPVYQSGYDPDDSDDDDDQTSTRSYSRSYSSYDSGSYDVDEDDEDYEDEECEEEDSEDVEALAQTTLTDDGIPISESMPYKGMDAKFIDVTWMGEHDGTEEAVGGGLKEGSIPYYWLADNDTGDKVFTAYVRDGEVIAVCKNNTGTDYWEDPDGSVVTLDYPNLTGTGEYVDYRSGSSNIRLEDATDYSTPEEFADNNEDYFAAQGSDDPWNDAYEYWEQNAA